MQFGVYDTRDQRWIGITSGPLLYKGAEEAAKVARILAARLGWPPNRLKAFPFNGRAKKTERKPELSAADALNEADSEAPV